MYRKELLETLLNNPMSLQDLAMAMDEPVKDIDGDLEHLRKSLRRSAYRLEITPARCRKCGFVFSGDKMNKPGKCPECLATWISVPLIAIRERGR
jgi:predicted Zn-ribbon and HTH transcriptional regulator